MNTAPRLLLVSAAAASVLIALAGCSVVEELAYKQRDLSYDTAAELTSDWDGTAAWVPDDATGVRIVESSGEDDTAVLILTSAEELDEAVCAPIDRQSGPAYDPGDAPDPYAMSDAWSCGVWTVVATDDGWYGWTPNHPDEEAQSPDVTS